MYASELGRKLREKGETFRDITQSMLSTPWQFVVATDTHIYACTRTTGRKIHVSVSINPEVLKPEDIPIGFEVGERISGKYPYFILRTSKENYSMAEQQGYKRLVPIYRVNEDTIQTLIGTAWVHYSDNDTVKDNKERLVSMEMLGLKLDSADKHYAFWSGCD